jgi:hypothetical protein
MYSQTTNIIVLHIDLTGGPSCPELHKRGHGLEDMSSHGGSKNDGLKKALKFECPKHDVLEVEKIKDDLESCILKVQCDKAMLARLMKNWKEREQSSHWGSVK